MTEKTPSLPRILITKNYLKYKETQNHLKIEGNRLPELEASDNVTTGRAWSWSINRA